MKYGVPFVIIAIILLMCALMLNVNALNYASDQIKNGNAHGTCQDTPGCHLYTDIILIIILTASAIVLGVTGIRRLNPNTLINNAVKSNEPKTIVNIDDIFKR